MRTLPFAFGLALIAFCISGGGSGLAQQQTSKQDSTQPSSKQQKDGGKAQQPSRSSSSSGSSAPHSTAADNPFPESVSRAAAGKPSPDAPADAPSPQPDSKAGHSTADTNPFPEDLSRKAARAAGDASSSPALPPGVSSSQSSGAESDAPAIKDPARAKKDAQIGGFYLEQGNSQGAYLRYQDAMKYDPTNIEAIFGAAEAARKLGKNSEAARDYELYLSINPNGPKAKKGPQIARYVNRGKVSGF